MAVKDTLRQWLAAGETTRALEALQDIAQSGNDQDFERDVTHQAGRFHSLKQDWNSGIIDRAFYNLQINNIRPALQDLVDRVPTIATLPEAMLLPINTGQQKVAPLGSPNPAPAISPHIPWIVGLSLLLGSAIFLVGFVRCPNPSEERIFQLLMAIGAAGMATILPGVFQLEAKNFKAGSVIGVFLLVYLVNPASVVKNDESCNKLPFEFTISLLQDRSLSLLEYPQLDHAVLQIRLDNKWESSEIDVNGDAHYRSIAGYFKDQKVAALLKARHWKLAQDSVALRGRSQALTIVPDGSLGKVEGKVMDIHTGSPLSGATVEILGISAKSGENGNFTLDIPLPKQTIYYDVDILLKGYRPYRGNAAPGATMRALLSK